MRIDFELKKWNKDYIDDVAKHANNPKIAANLRDVFPYPYTRKDAKEYVLDCMSNDEKNRFAEL
jgi:ribosomal-protein-alanine N-acetyltransferase